MRNKSRPEIPHYTILLAIILGRLSAAYVFSTFDDAFITYRYAVNLVRGYGLVYNPHEMVLGTTAPLFAFICAIPAFLSLSIPKFILVFNIGCDLISYYIIKKYLLTGKGSVALIFGLLFALDPSVNRISVGGMEANLFFLCSVTAIVCIVTNKRYLSYAIVTISYFLRPEAIILLGLLIFFDWYRRGHFPFAALGVSIALAGIPLLSIFLYYGQVLPQSVIAKNQQGMNAFTDLFPMVFLPTPLSYVIFPLALFGGLLAFRIGISYKILAVWIAVYAAAYLIRGPWILNWYIYSIAAGELVLAAIALEKMISAVRFPLSAKKVVFAAVAIICFWGFLAVHMGRSRTETNIFSKLRQDFGDGSGKGKVFFADDIGALGFYTDAYIYDDLMLVTPQAAQYSSPKERIAHLKPDYLFLYADRNYMNLITTDTVVSGNYSFIKRYSKNGETRFPEAYSAGVGYRQDFILLKRR